MRKYISLILLGVLFSGCSIPKSMSPRELVAINHFFDKQNLKKSMLISMSASNGVIILCVSMNPPTPGAFTEYLIDYDGNVLEKYSGK